MNFTTSLLQCLLVITSMLWSILWALIFGFALSALVIVFVPKDKMANLFGTPGFKEISLATFFGSVSSSCSYAAAAMARSLFEKGAHLICALAFMMASTNLVIELSAVLWILMGWQFVVAEFLGGVVMIFIMTILMKIFAPLGQLKLVGAHGKGDHGTTMPQTPTNFTSLEAWSAVGQVFMSEWKMLYKDILLGLVISGVLMVYVPERFWQGLFLQNKPGENFSLLVLIENAMVGPLVSVFSFVCSVGNIPVAGVLYQGGITFGGALSFIYADLIIIPLILIYKKYYGVRGAAWISGIFYLSIVITGILVDLLFRGLHWVPEAPHRQTMNAMPHFSWNYTSWLNILFIIIGLLLFVISGKEKETESCCH